MIERARGGDREAFDVLVRVTYSDTYTLAYRLTGDPDDARDVAQEAYLRAYRSIKKFRGDAAFSTWMYRITANCAAKHSGRRKRDTHDELDSEEVVVDLRPGIDPLERATQSDTGRVLRAALTQLRPKLRSVVVLRDVYDLSHEAIAEELGITVAAAKVRLHRGRRQLRAMLYPLPDEVDDAL